MPFALDAATFPALSPEALQAVQETSRAERLLALAGHLAVTPDTALATLAEASRLPLLADPAINPDQLRLFPGRLVHEYQIVPVKIASPADSTIVRSRSVLFSATSMKVAIMTLLNGIA